MVSGDPHSAFSTGAANERFAVITQVQVLASTTRFAFEGRLKPRIKEAHATGAEVPSLDGLMRGRILQSSTNFASPGMDHNCSSTHHDCTRLWTRMSCASSFLKEYNSS